MRSSYVIHLLNNHLMNIFSCCAFFYTQKCIRGFIHIMARKTHFTFFFSIYFPNRMFLCERFFIFVLRIAHSNEKFYRFFAFIFFVSFGKLEIEIVKLLADFSINCWLKYLDNIIFCLIEMGSTVSNKAFIFFLMEKSSGKNFDNLFFEINGISFKIMIREVWVFIEKLREFWVVFIVYSHPQFAG